jgi:hypothetical protein
MKEGNALYPSRFSLQNGNTLYPPKNIGVITIYLLFEAKCTIPFACVKMNHIDIHAYIQAFENMALFPWFGPT